MLFAKSKNISLIWIKERNTTKKREIDFCDLLLQMATYLFVP